MAYLVRGRRVRLGVGCRISEVKSTKAITVHGEKTKNSLFPPTDTKNVNCFRAVYTVLLDGATPAQQIQTEIPKYATG